MYCQQLDQGNNIYVEQGEDKFIWFIDDDIYQIVGGGLILFCLWGEYLYIIVEEVYFGDDGDIVDKK